jgi:hypothetical protein
MDLHEVGWEGTDWITVASDRDRWQALVNAVMSLVVPYNRLPEDLLASEEGISSM